MEEFNLSKAPETAAYFISGLIEKLIFSYTKKILP